MNKIIYNIFITLALAFTQMIATNASSLLLAKISKVKPIEKTNMSDLLIKIRFKGQARKFDVQNILDKKHKAVKFEVDSFDTIKRNPLIIELHSKEHYDGKKPIASAEIIVNEEKQIRHKLNLRLVEASIRTQVNNDDDDISSTIARYGSDHDS